MQELLSVDDHPVRLESSVPAVERGAKLPALVLLHGAGGNAEFWRARLATPLAQAGVALFVPHYFERTGTVRADLGSISDGVHVPLWLQTLDVALDTIAKHPAVDPERIALLGISLGAFLSLAFAAESLQRSAATPRVRCIVELSGGFVEPYRSRANISFPPTLILHGEADAVVPVSFAHELDQRLSELGVPHEALLLPQEGHWFSGAAQLKLLVAVSGF